MRAPRATGQEQNMDASTSKRNSASRRFATGIGLVALSAAIVGYSLHERSARDESAPLAQATTVEAPAPAPAALDGGLIAQRYGSSAHLRASAAATAGYAISDPKAGLAQLHARLQGGASAAAKREQAVAQMESSHRAEPLDAAWSAASEQSFTVATSTPVMAAAGFKPQDVSTDCRSRTCRVSARFSSALDAQDWADRLVTQMGATIANARVAVLPQSDGSYEVRVFGARKA